MSVIISSSAGHRHDLLWRRVTSAAAIAAMTWAALIGLLTANTAAHAASPGPTRAYVVNTASKSVSVIDTTTNAVTSTVAVIAPFAIDPSTSAVAISPDGARAYVGHSDLYGTGKVSVIDTTTNTVTASILVGSKPIAIAASPSSARVYVANNNYHATFNGTISDSGTVSVINTGTNTVTATVWLPSGIKSIYGMAVSPDGSRVYVISDYYGYSYLTVIDAATNTVIATQFLESLKGMTAVVVSPDGSRVYAIGSRSGKASVVLVINTSTNTVAAQIGVDGDLRGMVSSPDGTRLYVTDYLNGRVLVINTATNTVASTIAVSTNPSGVALTPDGASAYVTNYSANKVSVINTATNTVTANISMAAGSGPNGIAIVAVPPRTTLTVRQQLTAGQQLISSDGRYLAMQTDGNLVFYNAAGTPLWASYTSGTGNYLAMQADGNLVLYNSVGSPLWATDTSGTGSGNYLMIQPGGDLELYNAAGTIQWSSGQTALYTGSSLSAGQRLYGYDLNTKRYTGRYLAMQKDGNLVLYNAAGSPLWATNTAGTGSGNYLRLQTDGNLVLYNSASTALWATSTVGKGSYVLAIRSDDGTLGLFSRNIDLLWSSSWTNTLSNGKKLRAGERLVSSDNSAYLEMQTDGNLVFYNNVGTPRWATNTNGTGSNNYLIMQTDGNLVLYNSAGTPLWATNTNGWGSGTYFMVAPYSLYLINGVTTWQVY